jgi:protein phosphatase 1 regulatory subunit 11
MQRARVHQRPSADGSRTLVIHDSAPREDTPANPDNNESPNEDSHNHSRDQRDDSGAPRLVLNLQGGGALRKKKPGQKVVWKEDVVDNEGCGRKKSKSQYPFVASVYGN